MPATDYHSSFLGRISIRRNQVVSMEGNHEQQLEDLELFQRHVYDRFNGLISSSDDVGFGESFLSVSWLRKLVDVFLCCEAEFKSVLTIDCDPSHMVKPPLDRLIPELLERAIKALDICNAVSGGVDCVRQYQKLAEIAVSALEQKPLGDGQVKRARKALSSLLAAMKLDDKENSDFKATERNWSFGRGGSTNGNSNKGRAVPGNFRSLSMIVAKNWSASKQIQAMWANLVAPRGGEPSGLASSVHVMSYVMVFVMWALVTALPCQERSGLATQFQFPRQLAWAQSMIGLQQKIGEEWRKKEKKGSVGLLEEMQRMEKLSQSLIEFADEFQFPIEEENMKEMKTHVAEMAEICWRMEEGLVALQMQIREMFHRIVRSRNEVLELLDNASKLSQPVT